MNGHFLNNKSIGLQLIIKYKTIKASHHYAYFYVDALIRIREIPSTMGWCEWDKVELRSIYFQGGKRLKCVILAIKDEFQGIQLLITGGL